MCARAAAVFPDGRVEVSRVESTLPPPSRTLLTLRHLLGLHPTIRFSFVMGADILRERDAWYRFDEIERLVPILVVGRSGYPSPAEELALPPIRSSAIRARLRERRDVADRVPKGVLDYITAHQLYI
jgi:nicotinate-nucleotide adenylyltransferase